MIYTRLTTKSMSDTVINNININQSSMNKLQEQIASGKEIFRPSDNPTAAISILNTNTVLDKIEIYSNNIDSAISELTMTEQAINNAINVVQRANEITVQAANGLNSEDELSIINAEVEQLIEEIKDLGNTKYNDKYIFGGLVTEQPPFNKNLTAPFEGLEYIGSPDGSHERLCQVSEGVEIPLNIAGDSIFGSYVYDTSVTPATKTGSGLLNTLEDISSALEASPTDFDAIRNQLDFLDDDLNVLLSTQSEIGGLQSRIEMTQNKLENDKISYTDFKSEMEDVDMAKAISDLTFQETALQASLKASSAIITTSILDYV